jgi:hypothetical protein
MWLSGGARTAMAPRRIAAPNNLRASVPEMQPIVLFEEFTP